MANSKVSFANLNAFSLNKLTERNFRIVCTLHHEKKKFLPGRKFPKVFRGKKALNVNGIITLIQVPCNLIYRCVKMNVPSESDLTSGLRVKQTIYTIYIRGSSSVLTSCRVDKLIRITSTVKKRD